MSRRSRELFKVIRKLRNEGLGIVFVTHFLEQVYAISDRITVLRDGRLVGEYETASLPKVELVSRMIGKAITQLEPLQRLRHLLKPVTSANHLLRFGSSGAPVRSRR